MKKESIVVHKASGDVERFSVTKLKKFLQRIELPQKDVTRIATEISTYLPHETSTKEIAQNVSALLKQVPSGELYNARYNIKDAIRGLGPDGHLFEQYVGRLFVEDGYQVEVAVMVKGKCVSHEVDIVAVKGKQKYLVECKFHNREGIKSEVTIAMYSYARYLDIKSAHPDDGLEYFSCLATNTKLTSDAEKYANCMEMGILTVEAPEGQSIMDRVMQQQLFPITSLEELAPYIAELANQGLILLIDIFGLTEKDALHLHIPHQVLSQAKLKAGKILGSTPHHSLAKTAEQDDGAVVEFRSMHRVKA